MNELKRQHIISTQSGTARRDLQEDGRVTGRSISMAKTYLDIMGTKRDDFKVSTIETLRTRVASRCSNPDCRVPTTGPTMEVDKINNIGTAAHITAAASGGARYDKSLTYEERRSIDNAIWLCTNCSRDIDNDPDAFSVDFLRAWKISAEKIARNELGKKVPDDNYVIEMLTSTLTGQSNVFLPKLVSNACEATSTALEAIDPRFSVNTSYSKGINHFEIFAKQRVDAQFKINPSYAKEFCEKYINLQDHGERITIDSDAIDFKGSPLLENLTKNVKGRFEFVPSLEKKAVIRIWLISPDGESKYNFNELVGTAALGLKSMTCNCLGPNGLITMAIRIAIEDGVPTNGVSTIGLHFSYWDKKNLSQLSYIDKLHELYSKIFKGWQLNFELEIEGLHITSGHCTDTSARELFLDDFSHLNFIHMVREIVRILGVDLHYDDTFEYSTEFNLRIKEILEILRTEKVVSGKTIKENARCTLEVYEDLSNLKTIKDSEGKLTTIRIEQVEGDKIDPFKQPICLPRFSHILTEVTPKIISNISNIAPGDLIEIEWEPSNNCLYKIEKVKVQQGAQH